MSSSDEFPIPTLEGWALILGASSGFGATTALTLARAGMNVIGVHLDRRSNLQSVEALISAIRAVGKEAWFFNVNAADEERREAVLGDVRSRFDERGRGEKVSVFLHSLAFGSLLPFFGDGQAELTKQRHLEMTIDVMANSLVYWTQDLLQRDLLAASARVFAMTSSGSTAAWAGYGAVSAAKSALESHIRQLAIELGPRGVTANAICAGVTETPAWQKIPRSEVMREVALRKNPHGRLTTTDDVARSIAALCVPATYWLTGNVIYVDGGEAHSG